jgi:hypothetical protein
LLATYLDGAALATEGNTNQTNWTKVTDLYGVSHTTPKQRWANTLNGDCRL